MLPWERATKEETPVGMTLKAFRMIDGYIKQLTENVWFRESHILGALKMCVEEYEKKEHKKRAESIAQLGEGKGEEI